jgi:hypothetical protein
MADVQRAVRAAVVMGVRHAAHHLADYWLQPHEQGRAKGAAGRAGALACGKHVATYSVANALAVALASRVFDLGLSTRAMLAGELVSAVTHYAADRREHGPMIRLARRIGKQQYLEEGGGPALDQAWHHVANAIAAGVTAVVDG